MATLSAPWPNNPSSNPNSNPNYLSSDPLSPSLASQSEHHYYDSFTTALADDDSASSENVRAGAVSGDDVRGFLDHTQERPNFTPPNPNFVAPLSPPPPIRASAPDSPNSSLTGGSHSLAPTLLHVSFNQDSGCFAAGTDRGFRIYNCDPFREIFRRDCDRGFGGVGSVEMLFRCNILALVGGGPEPQYPLNKVMIWDDHQSRCIGELSFRSEVRGVRLRRDRIVVALEQKVFVYNFADLKLLHQIETTSNPRGLCEVSQTANLILVCPGLQKGQVRVEHYASKRTKFIMAHDSRIACFALTKDGSLLATASSKGTLVRVYNTMDGTLLQEVRRGADRAEIYSLAFSPTSQWLAVSSDKGTVHVFSLKVNSLTPSNDIPRPVSEVNTPSQSGSSLSFIKGVLPKYFSSEWSVAQFRLIEGSQYVVAFGHQTDTVVILGMNGSFYRCKFDPTKGGEMMQLEFHNFLKPAEPF